MKTTFKTTILMAATLAAALTLQSSAQAQVLALDNFNYGITTAPGTNIGTTGVFNGGSGWGGYWYTSGGSASLGYTSDMSSQSANGVPLSYAGLASGANYSSGYLREVTYAAGGLTSNDVNRALGSGVSGDDLAGDTLWGDLAFKYSSPGSTTAKYSIGGLTFTLASSSANQLLLFKVNYTATGVGTLSYWTNPSATAFDPSSTPTGTASIGDITGVDIGWTNVAGQDGDFAGGVVAFANNASDLVTTISAPEPSSWAMMAVGLASLGFMLRRKQNA